MSVIFLLWYLRAVGLAGWVADQKHRSEWGWIFLALWFSPLLALIALAAVPTLENLEDEDD